MKKTKNLKKSIEEFEKHGTSNITEVDDDELLDYDPDKDPDAVKKLEEMREFLRKHPYPGDSPRKTRKKKR